MLSPSCDRSDNEVRYYCCFNLDGKTIVTKVTETSIITKNKLLAKQQEQNNILSRFKNEMLANYNHNDDFVTILSSYANTTVKL